MYSITKQKLAVDIFATPRLQRSVALYNQTCDDAVLTYSVW